MKRLYSVLIATFLLLISSVSLTLTANAQCNSAPNGFGGVDITCIGANFGQVLGTANQDMAIIEDGANLTNTGDPIIDLLDGNDTIIMNGGNVERTDGMGNGLNSGIGNDTFIINGGSVTAGFSLNCDTGDDIVTINDGMLDGEINLSSGNDTMNMNGGTLTEEGNAVNAANGDDTINILGGTVIGGSDGSGDGFNLANGEDSILISNATISGSPLAIRASSDDDLITIGSGAVIDGLIDCGSDFDTIIFTMDVPTNQLAAITSEIESLDPAGDSIIINSELYEWEDCELLVAQLQGGFATPVPTLSQWGLIATAALLGVFAIITARRRFLTN